MDFDIKTFSKTLDAAMEVQLRQAARAWLRAMLEMKLPVIRGVSKNIGSPPVWTGTARGTLQGLGRELRVKVEIKPVVKIPGFGPDTSPAKGRFAFGKKFDRYYFRYSNTLDYYNLNEFEVSKKKLIHKTPWLGFKEGQRAFQDYCNTELGRKLPKVRDSIKFATRVIR